MFKRIFFFNWESPGTLTLLLKFALWFSLLQHISLWLPFTEILTILPAFSLCWACSLWIPAFLSQFTLCFGEMHPLVTFKKMYEKVKLLRCLYCWKCLSSTLTLGWLFGWSGHRIPRWNIFPSKFKGFHYNYLASGGCWKVLCLLVFILPC